MPAIKPRTTQKHFVRHITRLYRENNETLFAYAHFLGESTDYVLNEVIDTMLAKDKEFLNWRTEHGESFVPSVPAPQPPRRRRAARRADAAATSPKAAEELTPARS